VIERVRNHWRVILIVAALAALVVVALTPWQPTLSLALVGGSALVMACALVGERPR
jgi:hypothetical protein